MDGKMKAKWKGFFWLFFVAAFSALLAAGKDWIGRGGGRADWARMAAKKWGLAAGGTGKTERQKNGQ